MNAMISAFFMPQNVMNVIGNNNERKEITSGRYKILMWKNLSNKERGKNHGR
jgi:hypothetical protein